MSKILDKQYAKDLIAMAKQIQQGENMDETNFELLMSVANHLEDKDL